MGDLFISYARPDETAAERVSAALGEAGFAVWRDDQLPATRTYAEVIEERLAGAKAVLVLWSKAAVKSQWVRAEADFARNAGTLVQASLDGTSPPIPFNQIRFVDLSGWSNQPSHGGWKVVLDSLGGLVTATHAVASARRDRNGISICVLPFENMSGDAEQEYFSDGISEDITTDLSKISALAVTARNTAFQFKGMAIDVCEVARKLGVTHVLEGSVRKVGDRVRLNAQLIIGATGAHLWAERYDRDLTDIFAIQDELSKAIVDALKLKLLPEEKSAIEQRGTTNAEAYDLYLMARQQWISGNDGDRRRDDLILRLCQQAIALDPDYALAWALMAITQTWMHHRDKDYSENGVAAAKKALELDPTLAEPHVALANNLAQEARFDEARAEIAIAMRIDPESWDVNRDAAFIAFRQDRMKDAFDYFEKASALMETDSRSPAMMISCAKGLNDPEGMKRGAEMSLERVERMLGQDRNNAALLGYGVTALAVLGEHDRARDWRRRALLLDPDNVILLFNLACASLTMDDIDIAIDLVGPFMAKCGKYQVMHAEVDPDLDKLRDDPRFQAMLDAARKRVGGGAA